MPSPFPGMDPYLEGEEWVSFHAELAVEIARQLAPQLRPRYLARVNKRYIMEKPELAVVRQDRRPDVGVIERRPGGSGADGGGATTVASPGVGPLRLVTVVPEKVPQYSVEIRDVAERDLVTAIEILSPANKIGNRDEYIAKHGQILLSPAHLMEIDLTRRGERVPMRQPLPSVPYFVVLSRDEAKPVAEVWPITLDESLPTIPVPLLHDDPDGWLDLQATLHRVYDAHAYDLVIDYSNPPQISLSADEGAWADTLLRAAGLRA